MTAAWERKLGSLIWDAKTSEDATKIINECKRRFHPKPIAVARENNSGTINMASDSGLALVERITNGIDSRIELACLGNPGLNLSSPEEASSPWLQESLVPLVVPMPVKVPWFFKRNEESSARIAT